MKIYKFQFNPFETNCYVYYDEVSKEAVLIDPAVYYESEKNALADFTKNENLSVKYILNTHGHLDHILGNNWSKNHYKAPVLMNREDFPLLDQAEMHARMFGINLDNKPAVDTAFDEKSILSLKNFGLKILGVPGHSPGGVCFTDEKEKLIFCGDSIFKGSIGRTDLWKGDLHQLLDSINKKIFIYDDDFLLLPGHYETTTVGDEKAYNPFLNENKI